MPPNFPHSFLSLIVLIFAIFIMDSTFTFYLRGLFSRSVDVYLGDISDRPKPKEGKGPPPMYSFEVHTRRIDFRTGDKPQATPLLSGKYEGISGRRAIIKGDGLISTVKSSCGWSYKTTFIYNSDEYTWSVSKLGKSWTLHNHSGETLAVFDRSAYKIHRLGELHMVTGVDENLKQLIMFTCEMVYLTVTSNEAAAASA